MIPERLKSKNALYITAASLVGALALTGCSGSATDARKTMSVQERIGFDYADWTVNNGSWSFTGQDCLESTPYDPDSAVITTHKSKSGLLVAELIPKGTRNPKLDLSLIGFNKPSEYLQPANTQSANILGIYGCDPSAPQPVGSP